MQSTELIKQYLKQQHMMQLATVADGQPWCCTVYYVVDTAYNLYWASLPSRRHSQELKKHPQVAAAIPVKFAKGQKVAGLQVEGLAKELTTSPELRPIAEIYAQKFSRDAEWVEDITAGKTDHRFYKLTPTFYMLFDEQNFPDNPQREWRPTA